jgi:1-acyl-sn-glycerol-3-phosphate acyltransferase
MKRPKIAVENYREVYNYFRQYDPQARPLQLAYAALNGIFRPRVTFADRAQDDLVRINETQTPHIYYFNHLTNYDGFVINAALHQIAPDDIGNIRTLAADFNFRQLGPLPIPIPLPVMEAFGLAPVFRHMDYPDVEDMTAVHDESFNYFRDLLVKGEKIAGAQEGETNKTDDPTTLLRTRSGLGIIAYRTAELLDRPVAMTPIAMSYGRHRRAMTNPFKTSIYVGRSLFFPPGTRSINFHSRTALQYADTMAHELY